MAKEICEFLEQKDGVKRVEYGFNEMIITFDDGSEFTFRAEGYGGTKLNVTAKVLITKFATID